jgi:hypothetical protein
MSSVGPRRIVIDGLRSPEIQQVCRLLLRVALSLEDLLQYVTVVGGLVPVLLIDQEQTGSGFAAHAGTRDLDLGFDLALAEARLILKLGQRLASCGLERESATRWADAKVSGIKVDLLVPASDIAPSRTSFMISQDVEASAIDGLALAFQQPVSVLLLSKASGGGELCCTVQCCNPAAYVLLKTMALVSRMAGKDAYDMVYVLQYWPHGMHDIAQRLSAWASDPEVAKVIAQLRGLFADYDAEGPELYAEFNAGKQSHIPIPHGGYVWRAEAHAAVLQLLRELDSCGV